MRFFWILPAALVLGSGLSQSSAVRAAETVLPPSSANLSVSVNDATGAYTVTAANAHWSFAGTVGEPLAHITVNKGHDKLGDYREVGFQWGKPLRRGTIRNYQSRPLVAFGITTPGAAKEPPPDFPSFTAFPQNLHTLSFRDTVFSPPTFSLAQTSTPWVLFDDAAQTAVLSPASDFMVSQMHGDGKTSLASGLNATLTNLPAGFTHQSFFVVGQGIGSTVHAWGKTLTDLTGKPDPNDSEKMLRYLGYWTDNGGSYYYNYDKDKGYTGTLLALKQHYDQEKVPARYLQLDSWWYQKSMRSPGGVMGKPKNSKLPLESWNTYGGTLDYSASPDLFPKGLADFQKQVDLPFIVHARWLDPTGPYAQKYKLSGVAPVDPVWWDERMAYLRTNGVISYEQDWLNEIYAHSPEMASSLATGPAFADNMARSAKENGLTLQYCMATPRYFLQGSRYNNLTTIRTSEDRFERSKWNNFLYTSLLADSLHVRPWTDVFKSTEMGNLIISTLSCGPVGPGDRIGEESRENILMAVRADGVIVKPDVPLVPTDASILAGANQRHQPLVSATYTDNGIRTAYVFACARRGDMGAASFTPASLGLSGTVYVYDTAAKTATRQQASDAISTTRNRLVTRPIPSPRSGSPESHFSAMRAISSGPDDSVCRLSAKKRKN